MKTQRQSQQIIEAHRKDLKVAEDAVLYWKEREKEIKTSLRGHEKHAVKVEKLAQKEAK